LNPCCSCSKQQTRQEGDEYRHLFGNAAYSRPVTYLLAHFDFLSRGTTKFSRRVYRCSRKECRNRLIVVIAHGLRRAWPALAGLVVSTSPTVPVSAVRASTLSASMASNLTIAKRLRAHVHPNFSSTWNKTRHFSSFLWPPLLTGQDSRRGDGSGTGNTKAHFSFSSESSSSSINKLFIIQPKQKYDRSTLLSSSSKNAISHSHAGGHAHGGGGVRIPTKSTSNKKNAQRAVASRERTKRIGNTSTTEREELIKHTQASFSSPLQSQRIPVQSIYAAREINTVSVLSKVFSQPKYPTLQHRFGRMSVTIELEPRMLEADPHVVAPPRFVVVFRFGAVVFFNVTHRESRQILEDIKFTKGCSLDPVPNGFEQRERFEVSIAPPSLESASDNYNDDSDSNETEEDVVASDAVTVPHLDFNNVAVISTIMGQTVALDTFNVIVDELLRSFAAINTKVTQTGNFSTMERDALFKLVAQNNSLSIDMVSKFGLKDRSDTAWNLSQYDAVYQGMREEFEIDYRFNDVELKLDIIQQNAKFFLEILHNQKSNNLEWVIIWLISIECGLMCLDMSGMGQVLFDKYFAFK
jgi:uncharacterized Rmd1/YagE family protein